MFRHLRPPTVREFIDDADTVAARRGLLIAKLYYFCYFGAIGAITPFFTIYLEQIGLNGAQIGWLSSIPPLVALVANPFWGAIADRWQIHKYILALLTLVGGLMSLLFLTSTQFSLIMLFVIGMTFFRRPVSSILDSTTVNLVKQSSDTYGRQRMWGSLGFALISYSLGRLLSMQDLTLAFWIHAAILVLGSTGLGLLLPVQINKKRVDLKAGLQVLIRQRSYLFFLVSAACFGYGMASYITFLSLHMLGIGGTSTQLGLMWFVMGAIEVPVMYFGSRRIEGYGYRRILQLCFLGLALAWMALAWAPSPIYLILNVIVIGACFSCYWVSVVNYANEAAPPGLSATAQALVSAAQSGIGGSLGAISAGYLWDLSGATAVFIGASLAALLAALSFWLGHRTEW